jgi:hypothetical protein
MQGKKMKINETMGFETTGSNKNGDYMMVRKIVPET